MEQVAAYKDGTIQLPAQLSTLAAEVDWLYYFIFWLSVVFFVGIVGSMFYFVWRYRERASHKAKPTGHSTLLEIGWTCAPLVILFFLFHWGFEGYIASAVAPADAIDIRVRGMQWNWEFEHENGMLQMNELTVPEGRPVRLIMSSSGVLHSFFVPAFRVKQDVVPGRYTTLWFQPTEKGRVQVYCTEYCGAPPGASGNVGHSAMMAVIDVVEVEKYERFLAEGPAMPEGLTPAGWGEQLVGKYGCRTCHNVDGVTKMPAPNFKGLVGRQETLVGGESVDVDRNYIRQSILQPQSQIVAGYQNILMPPYRMPDKQIDAIFAYMKSLND